MDTTNGHAQTSGPVLTPGMTLSEKADAVEEHLLDELNLHVAKSVLFTSGEQADVFHEHADGRLLLKHAGQLAWSRRSSA